MGSKMYEGSEGKEKSKSESETEFNANEEEVSKAEL